MQIHQNKSLAQPIGLALFVFFGAFVLSAFVSHSFTPVGDSSALDSEVSVEIEPSLSLAIMDKDPSNLSNGEVASTIGTMSMEVTPNASGVFISSTAYVVAGSNNETGYTLSFSDTDNNTALTNTDPTVTTTIPSISTPSSSLADITANQWGYAFNTDTVFSPIPALSSPVELAKTSIPASNVYPFTAASKIDMSVPSGVYQDSLVFSLVANFVPTPHAVSFNANSSSYNPATVVTGTMPESIDLKYNRTITLPDNTTATRLGYRFLGWDEDDSATTPTYQAGDIVDYTDLSGDTVTMYAIWQPKNFPTTLTTMQGMTSDICADVYTPTANSTTIEAIKADGSNYYYSADNVAQSTLSDIRDSNTYVVRKLADGNCWMVQNLNLRLATTQTFTNLDTDFNTKTAWTPTYNTQTTTGVAWEENVARSYTDGTSAHGVLYNFEAATAGTSHTISVTADGGAVNLEDSLCPKNWRLPHGYRTVPDKTSDFVYLIGNILGLTWRGTANALDSTTQAQLATDAAKFQNYFDVSDSTGYYLDGRLTNNPSYNINLNVAVYHTDAKYYMGGGPVYESLTVNNTISLRLLAVYSIDVAAGAAIRCLAR